MTYVWPKQETGLVIVIGMKVIPYQRLPLQYLWHDIQICCLVCSKERAQCIWQGFATQQDWWENSWCEAIQTLASSWHSDAVIVAETTLAPVQNTCRKSFPSFLRNGGTTIRYVNCTFISGWRVFPSVARYSESATSGPGVKDSECLSSRRHKSTWHGAGGAVFHGAQKHLWPV